MTPGGTRSDLKFEARLGDIPYEPDELLNLSVRWAEWDGDVWGFALDLVGRPKQDGAPGGRGIWEADWMMSEREVRSLVEFLTAALARLP